MSKILVNSIINALLAVVFIYLGLGPMKYLKKIFTPTGQIYWRYVFVNLLIINALVIYAITNISLYMENVNNQNRKINVESSDKNKELPRRRSVGIKIENSKGVKLKNNTIQGFDTGINANNSEDIETENNKIDK